MTSNRFILSLCAVAAILFLIVFTLLTPRITAPSKPSKNNYFAKQAITPKSVPQRLAIPLATIEDISSRRNEINRLILDLRSNDRSKVITAREFMCGTPGSHMIWMDTPEIRTRGFYSSMVLCAMNSGEPIDRRLADDLIQAIAESARYDDQNVHMALLSMLDMPLKLAKESMETILSTQASGLKDWWMRSVVRRRLLNDDKTGRVSTPPNNKLDQ